METQELIDRTTAALAAEPKNKAELQKLYWHCFGANCYTLTRIVYKLQNFLQDKERYALRIKEAQIIMAEAKKSNYRFSKNATSKIIVLNTKNGPVKVTPETLTDDNAKLVLANKNFAHNIEKIEEPKAEAKTTAKKSDSDSDKK